METHRRRRVRFEDDDSENRDTNARSTRATSHSSAGVGLRERPLVPASAASTLSKYLFIHSDRDVYEPIASETRTVGKQPHRVTQQSSSALGGVYSRLHRPDVNGAGTSDVKSSSPRSRFLAKRNEMSASHSSSFPVLRSPLQFSSTVTTSTPSIRGISAEQRLRQKIQEAKHIRETKGVVITRPIPTLELPSSVLEVDATRTMISMDAPVPHRKPEMPRLSDRVPTSKPTGRDSSVQVNLPASPAISNVVQLSEGASTIQCWWRAVRRKITVEKPTVIGSDEEASPLKAATVRGDESSARISDAPPPPVFVTIVTVAPEAMQLQDTISTDEQVLQQQCEASLSIAAHMWDDDELSFLEEGHAGVRELVMDTATKPSLLGANSSDEANDGYSQDCAFGSPLSPASVSPVDTVETPPPTEAPPSTRPATVRVHKQKRRSWQARRRRSKRTSDRIAIACAPRPEPASSLGAMAAGTESGIGLEQAEVYVVFGDDCCTNAAGLAEPERNDLISIVTENLVSTIAFAEEHETPLVQATVNDDEDSGTSNEYSAKDQDLSTVQGSASPQQRQPLLLLCDSPTPSSATVQLAAPSSNEQFVVMFPSLHQVDTEVRRTLGRIQTQWRLQLSTSGSSSHFGSSTVPQRAGSDDDSHDIVEIGATPSPTLDHTKQREFLAALTEFQQSLRASITSSSALVASSSEISDGNDDSANDDDMDAELHAMLQEIQRCKESIAVARRGSALPQPVLTRRRSTDSLENVHPSTTTAVEDHASSAAI